MKKLLGTASIALAIAATATPVSVNWSGLIGPSVSIARAEARVGRPLTPGSVAGVHRRVERRSYRRGLYYGAAGAAAYGGYYYGQQYYQQPYSYGQPYTYGQPYYYSAPYTYGPTYYYVQPACGYYYGGCY
jgi:hypothetical protein